MAEPIRSRSGLWRRARRIAQRLTLPEPFDTEAFLGMLALERGRPIELVPVAGKPNLPCGLVVTTDHADLIVYAADTSALHRRHILLHEAAHLVCGHAGDAPGRAGGPGSFGRPGAPGAGRDDAARDSAAASATADLMPHLSAELVRRVLGRTVYTEPQEREAELVASLILCRAARQDQDLPAPRAGGGEAGLEALFGLRDG